MDKTINKKIVNNKSVFWIILMSVLAVMYLMAASGLMAQIDNGVAQVGKELAGYSNKVYDIEMINSQLEAVPILGEGYIEQTIYFDEQAISNKTLMLSFTMATYGRKNTGELYVDLGQGDETESFVIDLGTVEDNKEKKLVFETEKFHAGEISVKIYSPASTGENCVALYVLNNSSDNDSGFYFGYNLSDNTEDEAAYKSCYINGESEDKTAVIKVYQPSGLAKNEFRQIEKKETQTNEKGVYGVDINSVGDTIIPVLGSRVIEQTIVLDSNVIKGDTAVLGVIFGTYERANEGSLFIELVQDNTAQKYEIQLENIKNGVQNYLKFSTGDFKEGNCTVKIYSPESTGENCVAVFAANSADIFEAVKYDGEVYEQNIAIWVYFGEDEIESDFKICETEAD